jgi:hypothetical protein
MSEPVHATAEPSSSTGTPGPRTVTHTGVRVTIHPFTALSRELQDREVGLVVLDQGIDTSTAVGRMFFQILGAIAE